MGQKYAYCFWSTLSDGIAQTDLVTAQLEELINYLFYP